MSGSPGPIMGGAGVNASIPLMAGQGVPAPVNPLASVGQFAETMGKINQLKLFPGQQQLQQQAVQGGAVSLAQHINTAANAYMTPFLALPPEQQTHAAATDMAARAEAAGIPMGNFLADMASAPTGDGPDFQAGMASRIIARAQPPEKAVASIAPAAGTLNTGGQVIPTLTPAAGMAGQGVPVPAAPGFQLGYTPGQQMDGIHRPATQADIDAGRATAIGQDVVVPATTLPASAGYNPGLGGARIPSGALGPGGYTPPRQPLTQLGKPFTPPGSPASAAPGAGAAPRLMKGPGGSFMVPADKVQLFQQNGYQ